MQKLHTLQMKKIIEEATTAKAAEKMLTDVKFAISLCEQNCAAAAASVLKKTLPNLRKRLTEILKAA